VAAKTRIAELEAMLKWNDASDPPDSARNVEVQLHCGRCETDFYDRYRLRWRMWANEVMR